MSISVEAIKFDICCAARALYRAGLSAGVAGHLSVVIGENKMLMNRSVHPSAPSAPLTSALLISMAKFWSMIPRLIHM
jgi:hypothetical protein